MIFLGIDVGKSGAIAAIDFDGKTFVDGICKLSATDADVFAFIECVAGWGDCFAMIENVHSTPQMGVCSAFTFGRSLGFLYGVLTATRIPFESVSPQRWQKSMGCLTHGDKNISKAKAQQLWPKQKITHATADALLIAEYARRTLSHKEPNQ